MTQTGIIIGRFQVPYLHLGHIHLISTALRECSSVVILLGVAHKYMTDEKNPYGILQRREAIYKIFPQVSVVLLEDRKTDEMWSREVDRLASVYFNPVLYHSRDSFVTCYSGVIPTKAVPELPGYSGTKLRKEHVDNISDPSKPCNLCVDQVRT